MTDAATTTAKTTSKAVEDVEITVPDPQAEVRARLASLTAVATPPAVDPVVEARKEVVRNINERFGDFTSGLTVFLGTDFDIVDPEVAAKGLASLEQARKHFVKAAGTIDASNLV